MAQVKICTPRCNLFKCVKRALKFQGDKSWCDWGSDACSPKDCNYAVCVKRRLLPNGVCGFTIKRKTAEDIKPEEFMTESLKAKSKLLRRMGEKEVF